MRPDIEQSFVQKMETLGVKAVSSYEEVLKIFTYFVTIRHNFLPLMAPGTGWSEEQRVQLSLGQGGFNTGEHRKRDAGLLARAGGASSHFGAEAVQS